MHDAKINSDDLNLIKKVERGQHNNKLAEEFTRLKDRLLKEGRELSANGVWARAMLAFMPVLIEFLRRERRAQISPYDTIDGVTNAVAEIIVRSIQQALPQSEHRKAFDAVMLHLMDHAGPRLSRTDSGILLPPGAG